MVELRWWFSMKQQFPKLSIFDTFKTKREQLTGEAIRQRHIISHLARENSSTLMTRTAIAQNIAKKIIFFGRISILGFSVTWMKFLFR